MNWFGSSKRTKLIQVWNNFILSSLFRVTILSRVLLSSRCQLFRSIAINFCLWPSKLICHDQFEFAVLRKM